MRFEYKTPAYGRGRGGGMAEIRRELDAFLAAEERALRMDELWHSRFGDAMSALRAKRKLERTRAANNRKRASAGLL